MGAASEAVLWSFSGLGAASGGLYLIVTVAEIRSAGGVRRFVRSEVARIEEAVEEAVEAVDEKPIADA